jgi:hypothetical protein
MSASLIRAAVAALRSAAEAGVMVTDSKASADYAARLAREQGQRLRQRKMESGGWELRCARKRRQSSLF